MHGTHVELVPLLASALPFRLFPALQDTLVRVVSAVVDGGFQPLDVADPPKQAHLFEDLSSDIPIGMKGHCLDSDIFYQLQIGYFRMVQTLAAAKASLRAITSGCSSFVNKPDQS